jgi:dihydroxyacetone kinase-like predicted kinase
MSLTKKYKLDFILHVYDFSLQEVNNSLSEFGEGLLVVDSSWQEKRGKDFTVRIKTEDPQLVFDACSQLGRIRSVKIDQEEG